MPLDWATTQNNLGSALFRLGSWESGTERLELAVAALPRRWSGRERVPLQWAKTQNTLCSALRALGERESGTERLEQAIEAHQDAVAVWQASAVPEGWSVEAHGRIEEVQELIEKRRTRR